LIIYPIYMSWDVNITKNYSPEGTQLNFTNFNFINSPQPSLLIEHRQNLASYQFPNPVILYHVHLNALILKYLSNIQHLLLDVVEKKKTQKVIMRMLKLNMSSPMEWNTFLWCKTWEFDHSHNEPYLYTTLLCFTQSLETHIRFIPIIVIVNVFARPCANIPTKGLHFKLHPTNETFNALNKIYNFIINKNIQSTFLDQSSHLAKTILAHLLKWKETKSYTSWCKKKRKAPPKSKISKPFAIA
jgi:hypothetical protein